MVGERVRILGGRNKRVRFGMVLWTKPRAKARNWIYFVLPIGQSKVVKVRGRRVRPV